MFLLQFSNNIWKDIIYRHAGSLLKSEKLKIFLTIFRNAHEFLCGNLIKIKNKMKIQLFIHFFPFSNYTL